MKIQALAAIAAASSLALAGCQTTGGSTVPTALSDAIAYACPIAAGIQVSTLKLTPAQEAVINTAVADCNLYASGGTSAITSPATVAAVLVQAAVIIQESGGFKSLPHAKQAMINRNISRLRARYAL